MAILELSGVSRRYRQGGWFRKGRDLMAVRGVSLSLTPGCCLGLIGRSGSGKSTLGRLALGLEAPDEGAVLWRGRDVRGLRGADFTDFRRNVQVVFQNVQAAVNPRLPIWKIVAEPLENFDGLTGSAARDAAVSLLSRVGLGEADADRLPHQFSGGMLQRVCIARALAPRPACLVLDEAVSSLDMAVQAQIIDLLDEIRRETNAACLFISHDIRVIRRTCDELLVMEQGRLADRLAKPFEPGPGAHPALAELIAAILPARPNLPARSKVA
ncbi:ABC transporter related protein [Alkalidesulfovibrio alkalitolerans DSM 16529]|jgi:nickel transport system ATP-binding protein|uniref:ABC transporter related protein n=1 Tax=Alkalidesulfovibrio alkalitolerans DSM 16529 TaxID=1121439 RepID=S7TB56_9BACT|nr:dipeptide/oligopeptide/nickel ABC transporter ATP-binding protein [Alkalidesulfovibrio alkalitolerans]EPR34377.1 ABC transporter related protein [Alkalidesulfovibrio alkalitolerans DSM 16529]